MERYKPPKLAQRWLVLVLWLGSALPLAADTAADPLYAVAAAHYGRGEWESAAESFDRFLASPSVADLTHPLVANATYYRGECLVQLQRYREALETFERFVDRHPEHPQLIRAQFRAGEVAYRLGDRVKAERYLAEFRQENEGHELEAFAVPHLAAMALQQGDAARAAELYAFALQTFPRGPLAAECRLGVATAQENLGNLAEAKRFYRVAALSRDVAVATQAQLRLAILLHKDGDFPAALQLLESLHEQTSDSAIVPHIALWRGRALDRLGRELEAAEIWWECVASWPEHELSETLARQAAQSYRRAGTLSHAQRAYRWLSEHKPTGRWAEENLAAQIEILLEFGPLDERASVSPLDERASDSVVSRENETIRESTPDTDRRDRDSSAEAIALWRRMVREFPRSERRERTLQRLGQYLLRQGQYGVLLELLADTEDTDENATNELYSPHAESEGSQNSRSSSRVRSAHAPSPLVRYLSALAYLGEGNHESALQQLTPWSDNDWHRELRPALHRIRSKCLMAMRRFDEAIPVLENELALHTQPNSDGSRRFQLALALAESGRLAEAERVLDEAWKAAADSSPLEPPLDSQSKRAEKGDSGKTEEDENATEAVRPEWRNGWRLTVELAEKGFAASQYALAARLFRRVAEQSPDRQRAVEARLGWSWSLFQDSRFAEAGEVLDELLASRITDFANERLAESIDEDDFGSRSITNSSENRKDQPSGHGLAAAYAEGAFLRARIHERQNELAQAVQRYQLVLQWDATSRYTADALFAAGRLQDRLGAMAEAHELLGRLLLEFPEHSRADSARYLRAWSLVDLGQDELADEVFQELVDRNPSSEYWPDAVYRLAERAARSQETERTEQYLALLLEQSPQSDAAAQGLYLRGQLAAGAERWGDLETDMTRLLAEHPNHSLKLNAEYWLAESNYQLGRYEDSASRFEKLAAETESRQEAWIAMIPLRWSQSLAHQGKWRLALRVASTLEPRFPKFAQQYEADYVIGRAFVHEAKLSQARQAFERVTHSPGGRGSETAAMAQWMIGETYFHQRNFREAAQAYLMTETLYDYPRWRAAARLQLGKSYEAQQKWDAAIRYYKLVIDGREDPQLVSEAERRYSELQKREGNTASTRRIFSPR